MKCSKHILWPAVLLLVLLSLACQQSSVAPPVDVTPQPDFCARLGAACKLLNGTPYVWGGTSASGFDCSGAIYHIARQLGLPVPRTTSRKYWITNPSPSVHWQNASCGYLTWWQFSQSRPYGHVGIMVQDSSFWQAGSSTGFVKRQFEDGKFWDQKFQGAKEFWEQQPQS